MPRLLPLLLLVVACGQTTGTTATEPVGSPVTTVAGVTTTDFQPPLTDCPAPPYVPAVLPERVAASSVSATEVVHDVFTSLAGTQSQLWLDESGSLAVAIVRGSLPPEEWPGEKGEVNIDGVRAVAGQYVDGTWVVGWFEEPGDRCDLYTMVFYQPVTSAEVSATLESMNRVAG